MGDFIKELQTDKNPINAEETNLVDTLFPKSKTTLSNILDNDMISEFKGVLLLGILFTFFSSDFVQSLFSKIIPDTVSETVSLILKGLLFSIAVYALTATSIINID